MQVHVNEKCSPLHRISSNCELHMILKLTLNSDRVIFHGGWFCWILMLINNRYLDVLSKRYAGVAELGMHGVQVLLGNEAKLVPSKDLYWFVQHQIFRPSAAPVMYVILNNFFTVSFLILSSFTWSELISCT